MTKLFFINLELFYFNGIYLNKVTTPSCTPNSSALLVLNTSSVILLSVPSLILSCTEPVLAGTPAKILREVLLCLKKY